MVLLGEEAHVKSWFCLFGIVLILMQDRCTVCMEHTICSEINLEKTDGTIDAPDGTAR